MSLLLAWEQGLTKMPKSIPLRAALRIEFHFIVIDRPGMLMFDRMLELGSAEARNFWLV